VKQRAVFGAKGPWRWGFAHHRLSAQRRPPVDAWRSVPFWASQSAGTQTLSGYRVRTGLWRAAAFVRS